MGALCFICQRSARGFCWCEPPKKTAQPTAVDHHKKREVLRFCSVSCLDIQCDMYNKGIIVNGSQLEKQAEAAVIGPLADYVCGVGSDKGLKDYSKAEIDGLITIVLESYHNTLHELYKGEIPF